jgi:uncharacterized protein involved in cysteine biosynthesis
MLWEYPLSHFHALSHGSLVLILLLTNLLWLAVWTVAAMMRRAIAFLTARGPAYLPWLLRVCLPLVHVSEGLAYFIHSLSYCFDC